MSVYTKSWKMKVFFESKPRAIKSRMLSSEYFSAWSNVRSFLMKNFSSSEIGM